MGELIEHRWEDFRECLVRVSDANTYAVYDHPKSVPRSFTGIIEFPDAKLRDMFFEIQDTRVLGVQIVRMTDLIGLWEDIRADWAKVGPDNQCVYLATIERTFGLSFPSNGRSSGISALEEWVESECTGRVASLLIGENTEGYRVRISFENFDDFALWKLSFPRPQGRAHQWDMGKDNLCACKVCKTIWTKQNRDAKTCLI